MKTGHYNGEFDLDKALREWRRTHPDKQQRIQALKGVLRDVSEVYRVARYPDPRDHHFTRRNVRKLLRALGEDV